MSNYANRIQTDARIRNAYQEMTRPHRNRQRTRTLKGLACNCKLRGYIATTLRPHGTLSGFGAATPSGTPALIPISDPKAVAAAIKLFQGHRTVNGLGSTEQTQGAAAGATTGAKVGSIVPGIGTVIGAAIGAVVGWLSTKKKPVRATAQQVADCRALVAEYMNFARQSPSQPIPLDRQQLIDLNWCAQALYGSDVGLRDPRWFNPGFTDGLIPMARLAVKKIYETPVGKNVDLPEFSFKDPKGRVLKFKGFSFVNPQFTDLKTFTDNYFSKAAISFCENTAGKGAGGCPKLYGHEEWKRLLYDLLAWAAREELPNISEADLKEASKIAAQTGTAASDVVAAVEQIIGKTVERGQTAALLNPQGAPAPDIPLPSIAPGVTLPAAVPGLTLPNNVAPGAASSSSDVSALVASMLQQGASQTATLNELIQRGVPASQAQSAIQSAPITAGLSSNHWMIAGALSIAAVLFATARPAPRGRR